MRNGKSAQNRTSTWAAVAVMALCVAVSASLLFGRLMDYVAQERQLLIPLTESNRVTAVTAAKKTQKANLAARIPAAYTVYDGADAAAVSAHPGFHAQDENTVWSGETEVEIFRFSYDNASGDVTVHSQSGHKLLAPGTSNTYRFALHNTGNVSLDYTVEMEAYFSTPEYPIPVDVRVTDWQGAYLAGSAEQMDDVMALNAVRQTGTVAAGNVYPYALEWEWPYESGNDEYDTMLGNLAVEQDLTLTVVIRTMAEYSEDPDKPGGTPQTGDTTQVALLAGAMVVSLAGVLALLLLRGRKDDDEEA